MQNIHPGYIYTQRPYKEDKTLVRYVCLAVYPNYVELLRIGDGWRFNAFSPALNTKGYISWDHSENGRWDQEPTDQVVCEMDQKPNRLFPCEVRLQESIINISMIVGQFKAEGKIDPKWSHSEVVSSVIEAACKFEIEYGEVVAHDRGYDWTYDFLNKFGTQVDINVPQKKADLHDFQARQFVSFKNDNIFDSYPDCVCYGGEHADGIEDIFTRNDFLKMAGGAVEVAEHLFCMSDWQSPYTVLDEEIREGEIAICKKCKKMFLSIHEQHCTSCGAPYFPHMELNFKNGFTLRSTGERIKEER